MLVLETRKGIDAMMLERSKADADPLRTKVYIFSFSKNATWGFSKQNQKYVHFSMSHAHLFSIGARFQSAPVITRPVACAVPSERGPAARPGARSPIRRSQLDPAFAYTGLSFVYQMPVGILVGERVDVVLAGQEG